MKNSESFMTYIRHVTEANMRSRVWPEARTTLGATVLCYFRFPGKELAAERRSTQVGTTLDHSNSFTHLAAGNCSLEFLSRIFCKDSSTAALRQHGSETRAKKSKNRRHSLFSLTKLSGRGLGGRAAATKMLQWRCEVCPSRKAAAPLIWNSSDKCRTEEHLALMLLHETPSRKN